MSGQAIEAISEEYSGDWLSVTETKHEKSLGFINTGSITITRLELLHGSYLTDLEINYNCYGSPSKPAIVVLGGISASRNIHEWWGALFGGERPLDIDQYYVIGVDYISNLDAQSPKLISTFDQARVIEQVIDKLTNNKVEAIIGGSYGGMVALTYAYLFPTKINKFICVAAAHRNTQQSIAQRQVQQQILGLGLRTGEIKEAVSIARQLGVITYRSEFEIESRFDSLRYIEDQTVTFDVVNYLKHQGKKFANSFNIEKYRSLSQSIDLHKINPKEIHTRGLFIAIDSDRLVPPQLVEECARSCKGQTDFKLIHSQFGHDGFLLETTQLAECITPFLRNS